MAEPKTTEEFEYRAHYLLRLYTGLQNIIINNRKLEIPVTKEDIKWLAAELHEVYNDGYNAAIVEVK